MIRYYAKEWPVKDPKTGKVVKKYVARLTNQPRIETKELCNLMASGTLSPPEAQLAIGELEYRIVQALKMGRSVQIGNLFTIYPTIQSKSVDKKEDVGVDLIENVKIRVRPTPYLRNILDTELEFRKDRRF
jgi:predicted histone-like DNA-binding protein